MRYFLGLVLMASASAQTVYQLSGRIQPAASLAITIFGDTSPFNASTVADSDGRFTFKKLLPGDYTIAVFHPDYGEARRTVEIGPATAGKRQRVMVELDLNPGDYVLAPALRRNAVSTRELSISPKARRDYEDARQALSRRDADRATKKLEEAVAISPQFSAAWNQLGTIAYQTRNYDRAEQCFRRALAADPSAYEPLVNLGGVLVTLGRTDEALEDNRRAVAARPHDALANAQLGMAYFLAGDNASALRYLETARRIDPAHFSHPQLLMAEIHSRMGNPKAAAGDLEDFLKNHPDSPEAARIRRSIAQLEK